MTSPSMHSCSPGAPGPPGASAASEWSSTVTSSGAASPLLKDHTFTCSHRGQDTTQHLTTADKLLPAAMIGGQPFWAAANRAAAAFTRAVLAAPGVRRGATPAPPAAYLVALPAGRHLLAAGAQLCALDGRVVGVLDGLQAGRGLKAVKRESPAMQWTPAGSKAHRLRQRSGPQQPPTPICFSVSRSHRRMLLSALVLSSSPLCKRSGVGLGAEA
jgi:hypothetical protein